MSELKDFDQEKLYDEQISPLLQQVLKICMDNHLPTLMHVVYAVRGGRPAVSTSAIMYPDETPHFMLDEMFRFQHNIPPDDFLTEKEAHEVLDKPL